MSMQPLDRTAASDIDARGFVFALEPVLRKQQWQLDRQLAELGRAQRALAESEAAHAEAQRSHALQADAVRQALRHRIDPSSHRRALDHLSRAGAQSARLAEHSAAERDARDRCRAACTAQRLQVEAMSRHKDDALSHYAAEQRRRAGIEQDRDWIARVVAVRHGRGGRP